MAILRAYSGSPLIPGQLINIKQTLNNYNKTRDYAPYQKLMDVIYNALNPALQTPYAPPPKPHHESFWDELIIGLLAIVVMVIATPAIDLLPVQLIRRHVSSNFLSVICGDSISRSHKESFSLNDKRFNGVI